MSQKIKQGNIFGRIGSGIGQGLAEQVPKEIERSRLASGLQNIGKKEGLSPFQQFAELSAVPGVTPQMIQSGSELLKQQGIRNSFARRAGQGQQGQGVSPAQQQAQDLQNQYFPQMQQGQNQPNGNIQSQPQINPNNPIAQEALPLPEWTPQRREQEISNVLSDFPNMTIPEAIAEAGERERRELAQPLAVQERNKYLDEQKEKVNDLIDKQLREKLQIPKNEEAFSKLTGESLNNIRRGVSRDLALNPKSSVDDLVNTWTTRALDNEKSKKQLDSFAGKSFFEKITSKANIGEKLKSYQKIFKEFGNEEEYFNKLKTDFDFSSQTAAYYAFPLSKGINSIVDNVKPKLSPLNSSQNSISYAAKLRDNLTNGDSLLALAGALKDKDPYFDQSSFFTEVRRIQDELRLNARQQREVAEGESGILPTWGEILNLPSLRGKL